MVGEQKSGGIVHSELSGEDQDDLVWFFGSGQCCFERSVVGIQLRRSELYSFGSRLCPRCDGTGYTESQEEQIQKAIAAFEARPEKEKQRIREAIRKRTVTRDWYDDGSCRMCAGSGFVPRDRKHKRGGIVTVRPTVGELRPVPKEPHSDDLERYGFVSDQLRRLDDRHIQILAAFFGAAGSRNEHDKDRGRIFGVYALTPAGKKILRMAGHPAGGASTKKKAKKPDKQEPKPLQPDRHVSPPLALETEDELERTKSKPNRARLLKTAREQAEELLREAEQAWREKRPLRGRRRVRGPRRLESLQDVRIVASRTSDRFRAWVARYGESDGPVGPVAPIRDAAPRRLQELRECAG